MKVDKRRTVRNGGRRKSGPNKELQRYSPLDIDRICEVLGLVPVPENISTSGLVDLWNTNTDYYLPRIEDKGKELRIMSKPIEEQEDEDLLWTAVLRGV